MKKNQNNVEEKIIDAKDKVLGRLASQVALLLMGKNKASYVKHKYVGFPIKIINASKIKITNKKLEEIYHTRYSGYPGGLRILKGNYTVKTKGYKELIKLAIYHMLPANKLRREMIKNLKIEE